MSTQLKNIPSNLWVVRVGSNIFQGISYAGKPQVVSRYFLSNLWSQQLIQSLPPKIQIRNRIKIAKSSCFCRSCKPTSNFRPNRDHCYKNYRKINLRFWCTKLACLWKTLYSFVFCFCSLQWKRISRKQRARWQHLSQWKACVFLSLQIKY
jgi:hypothetical protein